MSESTAIKLLSNVNIEMEGTCKSEYSDNSEHLADTELQENINERASAQTEELFQNLPVTSSDQLKTSPLDSDIKLEAKGNPSPGDDSNIKLQQLEDDLHNVPPSINFQLFEESKVEIFSSQVPPQHRISHS